VTLYFITILAIANLGYFFGVTQTRHVVMCYSLILAFSTLMSLLIDFNYFGKGFVIFDQSALIEVISNTFNEE
jgi:hypothetical protein